MSTCTRLTKRGLPCRGNPIIWTGVTALPDPRACRPHLTESETAALAAYVAEREEARCRVLDADPSCWSWSWPAPEGEDWQRLLAWHHGLCAICGALNEGQVEDHEHETGLVRGYLCVGCNTREGLYGAAGLYVKYRLRPPAMILGVTIRYVHPITGREARSMAESAGGMWEDAVTDGIGL